MNNSEYRIFQCLQSAWRQSFGEKLLVSLLGLPEINHSSTGISKNWLTDGDVLARRLYEEFDDVEFIRNGTGKPKISKSWYADQMIISERIADWIKRDGYVKMDTEFLNNTSIPEMKNTWGDINGLGIRKDLIAHGGRMTSRVNCGLFHSSSIDLQMLICPDSTMCTFSIHWESRTIGKERCPCLRRCSTSRMSNGLQEGIRRVGILEECLGSSEFMRSMRELLFFLHKQLHLHVQPGGVS